MRLSKSFNLGGYCIAAHFVGGVPCFVSTDGTVHRGSERFRIVPPTVSPLASTLAPDGTALLIAADDGRVYRILHYGQPESLAASSRKWLTAVAAGSRGQFAYAAGKKVWLHDADGRVRELEYPRNVEAIGFSSDGTRMAVAQYGKATVHSLAALNKASIELEWAGMHIGLMFSPDDRFLMMVTRENLLHGWRLSDCRHIRMLGYVSRIESWGWTVGGKWLATSGAPKTVVWSFEGANGPIDSAPLVLGAHENSTVTAVACHPLRDIVAVGYADGTIEAANVSSSDRAFIQRGGGDAIMSLAWHCNGSQLLFGSESGECGIFIAQSQVRQTEKFVVGS